jgi:hypothetical protein
MRVRLLWCVTLLTIATAGSARAADPVYFLALGDSLAVGIQPAPGGEYVATNQGYVDDLYAYYHARVPNLRLKKLGCSGETTASMRGNAVSPCYPASSQLAEAVAFIASHHVALITIDIGADNLLGCINAMTGAIDFGCLSTNTSTVATDVIAIVGALKYAAGSGTLIVGMNYYDPFVAAYVFGPAGQVLYQQSLTIVNAFNTLLEWAYGIGGVPVANVARAFHTNEFPLNVAIALSWTWMSAPPPRGPDPHPNALGYLAIASAFAKTIGAQ